MEHRVSEELFEELSAGLPAGHGVAEVAAREPGVEILTTVPGFPGFAPAQSREDLRVQLAKLAALRAGRVRMAERARAERDVSAIPVTVQVDLKRRKVQP